MTTERNLRTFLEMCLALYHSKQAGKHTYTFQSG